MPQGPFGLPRPFTEYRVVIDPHNNGVKLLVVGPMGTTRPLARLNPPVEDEEVAECILSEAGRKFGAGVVSGGSTAKMSDLSPEDRQEALAITEKWCRGTLEAQAIQDLEEGEAIPELARVRERLQEVTGSEDRVTIEMPGEDDENRELREFIQPSAE